MNAADIAVETRGVIFNENGTKTAKPQNPQKDLNFFCKFLLCFSMITNGKKILSLAPATDNVGCINGIRFLSLTWVILGHVFAFFLAAISNPIYPYTTAIKRVTIQPIINGTFSVDSFFVLSGFLTSYLFFKRMGDKPETPRQKIKTVASMYLHRYLRLTPALGVLMGFSMFLPVYMTPFAYKTGSLDNTCDKYWWYNILYINNFKQDAGRCVGHVWYLANDMQFFLLAPILLYSFKTNRILGFGVSATLWLAHIATTLGITINGKYGILITDLANDTFNDIYTKPWTRIGPYIIGLVAGYLLYDFRLRPRRHHPVTVVAWWVASTAMGLAVIYGLTDYYQDPTVHPTKKANVLYLTFSRSAWGLAVSWVVYACATGYAGPVNTLLSWTPFGPVSRINYSAYLYHLLVINILVQNMKSKVAYDDVFIGFIYCGILVLAYGVAFLAAIWFESPFIALEKLIF